MSSTSAGEPQKARFLIRAIWVVLLLGACVGREVRIGIGTEGEETALSDSFVLPFQGTDAFTVVEGYKTIVTKRWFGYGLISSKTRFGGSADEPKPD